MNELFSQLLAWIGANPAWAYLVVFLVALAESVAVVGMIVPGVVIMVAAGALIATGELNFWPTATLAIAGAIVGDGFSYWIGYRYRDRLRRHWPFDRHPKPLERGIVFFERYGAKSVAFGRFVGPGRAIIPMVAGMMRMPRKRFATANISSAIAWGPAYLAPGIVFGASLKLAAEATARLAVLLLILISLIWIAAWLARQLFLLFSPHASEAVSRLLGWGSRHPTLGRVAQALAERDHPDAAALAGLALALVGATAVVGVSIGAGLVGAQDLTPNQIALDLGQSLHTPLADQVMIALSRLAEPMVTIPLVVAILVFLILNHQQRSLEYWLAALGFTLLATPVLGWLLQVPRPDLGFNLSWPWSFPSGHVLSATVLYGFLAVSLSRPIRPGWRWLPYAISAVVITAVASARIYLGTEWLSDVIGSIALGLAWTAALGLAFHQHTEAPGDVAGLALVSLVALGCAFAAATVTQQTPDLARYQSPPQTVDIAATQWRSRQALPLTNRREDLWRQDRRPFAMQYAGPLEPLIIALDNEGWSPAEMLDWSNAIKLLSPSLPVNELPLVPHVHQRHHDALRLTRELPNGRRLVLRLWATPVRIDATEPLWLGDITELTKETIMNLIALPISVPAGALGRQTLQTDLRRASTLKVDSGSPTLVTARSRSRLAD